ncbi:hypothetical protein PG987_000313 [Apiospora arundinis]
MEVGWALLASLRQREGGSITTAKSSIPDLVRQFDIQAKNTRVNGWYRGNPRAPAEDFPYGTIDHVDLDDLDERMDRHIGCLKQQANGRLLILVGFSIAYDLNHFYRDFPTGARHISAWVDLDNLLKRSQSPHVPSMGLGSSLRHLGYSATETPDPDVGMHQGKRSHVAAMDAIRTLALLEAVTGGNEEVRTRLLLEKKTNFPTLSVIAEPWTYPSPKFRLQILGARGRSGALPREIDSILKLGDLVYDRGNLAEFVGGHGRGSWYEGYTREHTREKKGLRAVRRQSGFLEFADKDKMRRFIEDASEWTFGGERLAIQVLFDPVTRYKLEHEKDQNDERKRKEREQKKHMPPLGILDKPEEEEEEEDIVDCLVGLCLDLV